MSGHLSEPGAWLFDARFLAADLRVIGGFIDRCDQLDVMPPDEVGDALQALVNVQHGVGLLVNERGRLSRVGLLRAFCAQKIGGARLVGVSPNAGVAPGDKA